MPRSMAVVDGVIRKVLPAVLGSMLAVAPAAAGAAEPAGEEGVSAGLGATVMSAELLEGLPTGAAAQGLHVQGDLRAADTDEAGEAVYGGLFRVDTGAAESIAPASVLEGLGIVPAGVADYERPDGTVEPCSYGLVRIEFMGEMREGRVLFGPEDVEPAIGAAALEAIGIAVDPETRTLQRATPEP